MDLVVLEPGVQGLGEMLAELVRSNLAREPERAELLRGRVSRVNVRASDADMVAGLMVGAGRFRVLPSSLPSPDLDIATDSATLMELSSVPLRFGLPDVATQAGRAITAKLVRGELRVRGMLLRLPLLSRVNRLISVL